MLSRRSVLTLWAAVACASRLGFLPDEAQASSGTPPYAPKLTEGVPFRPSLVRETARALAAQAFVPPDETIPPSLASLNYDQYRDIRFRPEAALWRGDGLDFEMQMFHPGFIYRRPVSINIVAGGLSRHLLFDPAMFSYGPLVTTPPVSVEDLGFSGFRLHGLINSPDYFDEITVFQGASYFRAVAAGQVYGLSARGLAIATAEPTGEEFPDFREFWIERPAPGAEVVVVHALLDSPSTTGAYRFTIRPGKATVMDVEAVLYPRKAIRHVGIAPLTSMFFFSPHDRAGVDDFRPSVHDSDGLLIWNGNGEWLWRPVLNPDTLQISAFLDRHPQGFGLMQRERDFAAYQDLEARYERRPSLWVEPLGDWGEGSVTLVEIPTDSEANDNIVAFWRPKEPLAAGSDYPFAYRLHWRDAPPADHGLAKVRRSMGGLAGAGSPVGSVTNRVFVIDFAGGELAAGDGPGTIEADVSVSGGTILPPVIKTDPLIDGVRVAVELDPGGERVIELRCVLRRGDRIISETWLYRWLA